MEEVSKEEEPTQQGSTCMRTEKYLFRERDLRSQAPSPSPPPQSPSPSPSPSDPTTVTITITPRPHHHHPHHSHHHLSQSVSDDMGLDYLISPKCHAHLQHKEALLYGVQDDLLILSMGFLFSWAPKSGLTNAAAMKLKDVSPRKKSYDKPRQSIKKQRHVLSTKIYLVKAVVFPVIVCRCESWTIKIEHKRRDTFELWCWRRLSRVRWIARRSSQSLLKSFSQP